MLKTLMSDLDTSSVGTNVEPAVSLCAEEEGFKDEEVVVPHIVPVSPIISPGVLLPNTTVNMPVPDSNITSHTADTQVPVCTITTPIIDAHVPTCTSPTPAVN